MKKEKKAQKKEKKTPKKDKTPQSKKEKEILYLALKKIFKKINALEKEIKDKPLRYTSQGTGELIEEDEYAPIAQPEEKELDWFFLDEAPQPNEPEYVIEVSERGEKKTGCSICGQDVMPSTLCAGCFNAKEQAKNKETRQENALSIEDLYSGSIPLVFPEQEPSTPILKEEKNIEDAALTKITDIPGLTFKDLRVKERKRILGYAVSELQNWFEAYSDFPLPIKQKEWGIEIGTSEELGLELLFTKAPDVPLNDFLDSLKYKRKKEASEDLSLRFKRVTGLEASKVLYEAVRFLKEGASYSKESNTMLKRIEAKIRER